MNFEVQNSNDHQQSAISHLPLPLFSCVHAVLYVTMLVGRSVSCFFGVFRAVFASLLLPNHTRLILPCIRPCSFAHLPPPPPPPPIHDV